MESDQQPGASGFDLVDLLDDGRAAGAGASSRVRATNPENGALSSGSPAHDAVAAQMAEIARASTGSGRFDFELNDTLASVVGWVNGCTGRLIGPGATWLRLIDPKRETGLLAVIHSPVMGPGMAAEADLILVAQSGMLTRSVIRDLCRWCFYGIPLRRVVVRVQAENAAMIDLVRRAGFEWNGRARDFFADGLDASVWSMSSTRCRWLSPPPPPPPAIPAADTSPPPSLKVH